MNKRRIVRTIIWTVIILPIFYLYASDWYNNYQESQNDFTIADVCQIKKGMNIDTAEEILGHPVEYHTYNFSSVYSTSYRNTNKKYFLEITYTQGKGTITNIYWGRARITTLAESGVCINQDHPNPANRER